MNVCFRANYALSNVLNVYKFLSAMTSPTRLGSAAHIGRGSETRALGKSRSNPIRTVRSQDMAGVYQPDHQPAAISVVSR